MPMATDADIIPSWLRQPPKWALLVGMFAAPPLIQTAAFFVDPAGYSGVGVWLPLCVGFASCLPWRGIHPVAHVALTIVYMAALWVVLGLNALTVGCAITGNCL
jgi:hypothetical protein